MTNENAVDENAAYGNAVDGNAAYRSAAHGNEGVTAAGARGAVRVPVSLYGFLRPRPEHADEVREVLAGLAVAAREEEGNLEYHLHAQDDGRLFLYEVWRSQEDLDRHNGTAPLREFFSRLDEYLAEPLEAYGGAMVSPFPAGHGAGAGREG